MNGLRPRLPILLATVLYAWAQQQDPAVFRADRRVVVCHISVVDKKGHSVTDLPQSAFAVSESGVAQTVTRFQREDLPVSLGLVIDNSGSMSSKAATVKTAALDLVKASNAADEEFVVNFNETAYLDLPHGKDFTNDIAELEYGLSLMKAMGYTAMRDAVRVSIDHLKKAHHEKKALVIVTDGEDNRSAVSMADLVKMAQQSDVVIYTVGILDGGDRRAQAQLKTLADATGGEAFLVKQVSQVEAVAQYIARDIRSQYTLEYSSLNSAMDGGYREIRIGVAAQGSPQVRTRPGYYAMPDSR